MPEQMRFVPHHLLDGRPSVALDGSPAPGTVLTVTHWPGYPPPAGIEADLSAQESSISPDRFVELLTDHLCTAPPAWEPFGPKS